MPDPLPRHIYVAVRVSKREGRCLTLFDSNEINIRSRYKSVLRPHVDHIFSTKPSFREKCSTSSEIYLFRLSTLRAHPTSDTSLPPCSTALSLVPRLDDFSLPFSSTNIPHCTADLWSLIKELSFPSLLDSKILFCKMIPDFIVFTRMGRFQKLHGFRKMCHRETTIPNARSACFLIPY